MPRRIPRYIGSHVPSFILVLFFALLFTTVISQCRVESIANDAKQLAEENRRRAIEGRQAHDAICALRNDLERRVITARAFLDQNPTGIPGIPAATLSRSIREQDRTIDTLDSQIGECPTEEEP